MSAFERAFAITLVHEGGYSNHPADPGKATMQGVTQATFNAYLARKDQPSRPVKTITSTELKEIYLTRYWNVVRGELLPPGLDLAVYDFAVNSGTARAIRYLQSVLGVHQDGQFGAVTLAALQEAVAARKVDAFIRRYCEARRGFLRGLSTFPVFGKGWSRRVDDIEHQALKAWRGAIETLPIGAPDQLPPKVFDETREQPPAEPASAAKRKGMMGLFAAIGTAITGVLGQFKTLVADLPVSPEMLQLGLIVVVIVATGMAVIEARKAEDVG